MKITEQMIILVKALPEPDRYIAINLIERRDFETLKELVESAIIKTERSLNTDSPKEVYINTDITQMQSLLSITESYLFACEGLEDTGEIELLQEDELIVEEGEE